MPENQGAEKHTMLFMGLVTSFQQNALIALGKLVDPISGKTERDLNVASSFIDMLDMLMVKTKGNITDEETTMLEQIVSHLKLNYVEETNKPDQPAEESTDDSTAEKQDEEPAAE